MTTTIDEAVQLLTASDDYRVLRRVPLVDRWSFPEACGETVRAAIVDCESTGLDLETDEVIELAIVPFEYEKATGRVVQVHADRIFSGFREPTVPIPEESQRVHGITPAMVAGCVITPEQVASAVEGVQLVIAHHASFDRPMLEKHWPMVFEQLCWACSFQDIDWSSEGLRSAKLDYLLMKHGCFHDGHRALDDVMALLFLLTQPLPVSGKPALGGLLEHARRPLSLVRATDTAYAGNPGLKARGWRWVGKPKAWTCATTEPVVELEWLKASKSWTPRSRVALRAVPARLRYSSRVYGESKGVAAT